MEDGVGVHCSATQLHATTSVSKKLEVSNKPKRSKKGVSFVKILGRDFSKQLQIPQEFTTNFNGYISHRFFLESAINKNCWRVEVEEDKDGRMYFRDGWGDFVEAHVLEVGNFLVFQYEEQSIFQVKIYSRNGCEKSAALTKTDGGHPKIGKATEFEENRENEAFKYQEAQKSSPQKTRRLSQSINEHGLYKKQRAVGRKYSRATKVSIDGNHVEFSITFHRRKTYQFLRVMLPKSVSTVKNLSSKDKLVLQDAKGNCWPVKLTHKIDGRAIFSQGWKEFLNDNGIAAGDTIKFEFLSDDLVQVHVTRTSQVKHHFKEAKHQNEARGSQNLDGKHFEPVILNRSSSFSLVWRKTTASNFLQIPKAVAVDQNLKNKGNIVLRDPDRKCWPIEVSSRPDGRTLLTKGWAEFWIEHGIIAGDFLSFEFISEGLVQVTIKKSKPIEHEQIRTESTSVNECATEGAAMNSEATGNEATATQLESMDNDGGAVIELEGIEVLIS